MKNVQPLLLFFTDENEKLSNNEVLDVLMVLELLPAQVVSINKASNLYNEQFRKVCGRWFVTFYFLLGSFIQCQLSVGIRSYFTQRDVCKKLGQMYLSIMEKYFSFEVTHNLRIALMNNTPPKKFFCWCYPFLLNIGFSLVFKHRTD